VRTPESAWLPHLGAHSRTICLCLNVCVGECVDVSFKCADSSAWRHDSTCGTVSDFMTAGQTHGMIPPVPQGFVRLTTLVKIDDLSARAQFARRATASDRNISYLYCAVADTITTKWSPKSVEFAAAVYAAAGGKTPQKSARPSA
jgi:hypothetical protein